MEELQKLLTAVVLLFFTIIINGFVFMKLWCWLLIPSLNFQPVTFVQAVAISFFIRTVTNRFRNGGLETIEDMINDFITWLVYIALALLSGYTITQFL